MFCETIIEYCDLSTMKSVLVPMRQKRAANTLLKAFQAIQTWSVGHRRRVQLLILLVFFSCSIRAQTAWSGILKPTYGTGACTYDSISTAGGCAVDWTQAGIPGGIPSGSWTQSGSTITASSGDRASTINSALASCGTNHYVLLGPGAFQVNSSINIPSNCVLRGSGPQSTTINSNITSGAVIQMGTFNDAPYKDQNATIVSGNTAGSTSIVITQTTTTSSGGSGYALSLTPCSSASACNAYWLITELNDPVYVSTTSIQNPSPCTYCDNSMYNGSRTRGQIVEVTSITGPSGGNYTLTFDPPLYTNYGVASGTAPAYATPFGVIAGNGKPDVENAGLENLQIDAYGTGLSAGSPNINISEAAYVWIKNVETAYTDGDQVDVEFCFRCEIRDSYFSNAFGHGAGGTDADLMLAGKTSGTLVQNNILERLHSCMLENWGNAGNVIAYNYCVANYDAVGIFSPVIDIGFHGPQPQFNLFEGNVLANITPDTFHGSSAYNTLFRNWMRSDALVAPYQAQAISSISCTSGTCTITWANPPSQFYAGQYIIISGTSNATCGGSSGPPNPNWIEPNALLGTPGTLSSQFSSASCTSATGGQAVTTDLVAVPAPITHQTIDWAHAWHTYQQPWGFADGFFNTNYNVIGNVFGSDAAKSTITALSAATYNSGSGCTSCIRPPATRPYSGQYDASSFGYDTGSDSTGSAPSSFQGGPSNAAGYWVGAAYATVCYSSNYDMASASTINDINCSASTTLPASFYLSSKPSWFGSVPWPAIGPDVSGGPDTSTAGHANYIPAEVCYNSLSRDSTGVLMFDANNCYASSSTSTSLNPPTNVTKVTQ